MDLFLYANGWYMKENELDDLKRIYSLRFQLDQTKVTLPTVIVWMVNVILDRIDYNKGSNRLRLTRLFDIFGESPSIYCLKYSPDDQESPSTRIFEEMFEILTSVSLIEVPELCDTLPDASVLPILNFDKIGV
jgi:hypothetical protein